jgi:hypothetical protein
MRIIEDNGMVAMLAPNSKEVNEILLLKGDQHGRRPHHCKSRIVQTGAQAQLVLQRRT